MLLIVLIFLATPLVAETTDAVEGFGGWHSIITAVLGVLGLVASTLAGKLYKTIKNLRNFIDTLDTSLEDHKLSEEEWNNIVAEFNKILAPWKKQDNG